MAVGIPIAFRQGTGNLSFNVDYFDYASGAGYKKYYLAGSKDSVSSKYFLTADSSLISDNDNMEVAGNAQDKDFDLTFNNPAVIANAEATINYTVEMNGLDGDTFAVTWTVYHVSTGSTETSLGTVTDYTSTDGNPANYREKCVKLTLTEKPLAIGEKLRINAVTAMSGSGKFYIDPSGTRSFTDNQSRTVTTRATINMPFKIAY